MSWKESKPVTWLKAILGPFGRLWMKFAHVIGKINTTILLTVFYFLFLGVARLVALIMRKDLMDSKWKDRMSYWKRRENFRVDRQAFLKPF